jgi:hypothetical protein
MTCCMSKDRLRTHTSVREHGCLEAFGSKSRLSRLAYWSEPRLAEPTAFRWLLRIPVIDLAGGRERFADGGGTNMRADAHATFSNLVESDILQVHPSRQWAQ